MERIRNKNNHWWKYEPAEGGFPDSWILYFKPTSRFFPASIALIQRADGKYYWISEERKVAIPGVVNAERDWITEPLETPLDDLMERIETEYGQYLETVRNYFDKLIDDFGYGLPS